MVSGGPCLVYASECEVGTLRKHVNWEFVVCGLALCLSLKVKGKYRNSELCAFWFETWKERKLEQRDS